MGRPALVALLLFVAVALGAAPVEDPQREALEAHCGSAQECAPHPAVAHARLRRALVGAGAHRELVHHITVACTPAGEQQQQPGSSVQRRSCQLALVQPLPTALYADVYELGNAVEVGQGPAAELFGAMDVESIESRSAATALAAYASAPLLRGQEACLDVNLTFPLHARYPRPRQPPLASSAAGWRAWLTSPPAVTELPEPTLLLHCASDGGWALAAPLQVEGQVAWPAPAGNVLQGPAVAAATAAAVLGGAAVVLVALARSGYAEQQKRKRS